jgi:hypothetical protein
MVCAPVMTRDWVVTKGVAGSSFTELLATCCDNILKKGGSKKLSAGAIEDTLEKKKGLQCI